MLSTLPALRNLRNTLLLIAATFTTSLHAQAVQAQDKLSLDPTHSEIHFTVDTTLHTVHGTFHMQQGDIAFDPATGKVTGSIVIDAPSGQSGNGSRDRRMSDEILKTTDFKTITFTPTHFAGTLNSTGDSTLKVHGTFTLLGNPHEIDVPMQVQVSGDQLHTTGTFTIPYVQWGVKDPSNFVFHVNKEVQIDLLLTGTLRR